MASTVLFLVLASTAFSIPSIISIQSSGFHPLTSSSSAVALSLTPSSGYVSTAKSTRPATTFSSSSLSTAQTSASSSSSPVAIHSFTQSELLSYSSTQLPKTLSSRIDTWTVPSSSYRVSSLSESTFITPRTSTGWATTLPRSSSSSTQPRSSPSSSSSSTSSTSSTPSIYSTSFPSFSSSASSSSSSSNTWNFTTTESTTPFPQYHTPTVTVTGGAAETSQAVQFIDLFQALYHNRQSISKQKDDYISNVKNIKSEVEGFVDGLSVKPLSDVGCSITVAKKGSEISKRDLTSIISGLAGNVGSLLSCADQVLGNMESVVEEDDPSIPEFESLTDAMNEISDQLQDANDNETATPSQTSASQTSVSQSNSRSASSSTTPQPSASSSSSSCSLETALHTSIVCVPSTITIGSAVVSTTTCSPLTTIATTGCSVTGWATTISSSVSTTSQTVCASDSCGTLCPMNPGPLSVSATSTIARAQYCASVATITTSFMPTASYFALSSSIDTTLIAEATAATPNKRNFSSFSETFDNTTSDHVSLDKRVIPPVTALDAAYVTSLRPDWISQAGNAATTWFDFPLNLNGFFEPSGVNGLYGCTSVVIVSMRGVYISHIWEGPVFIDGQGQPTSDDFFRQNTFNALYYGSATSMSILSLIGTDDNPGPLHAAYSPQVYVFSPFISDDDFYNGVTRTLEYEDRAIWLGDQLRQAIPGAGDTGYALGYRRTNSEVSVRPDVPYGKIIVEFDPFQDWLITPEDLYSGRRVAMWRLWVQEQLIDTQLFLVAIEYDTTTHFKREEGAFGYPNPCNSSSPSTSPSRQPSTAFSTASSTTSAPTSSSRLKSSTALAPTSSTRWSWSQSSTAQSSTSRPVSTTASTSPSSVVTSSSSISRSNSSRIPSTIPTQTSASTSSSSSSAIRSTTLKTTTTTAAPPITSCSITTAPAVTVSGTSYPAASNCQCANGWGGGISTSVGTNGASTIICEAGSSTIPVATFTPSSSTTTSSASSYATGRCNIHFYENIWANLDDPNNDNSIGVADYVSGTWYMIWSNMTATLTDTNGKTIGYNESFMRYHETFFIDSELPWVMEIMKTQPTLDLFTTLDLEASLVDYAYGSQKWTSGDAQCTLAPSGGWDNSNPNDRNRQMDCEFNCPGT